MAYGCFMVVCGGFGGLGALIGVYHDAKGCIMNIYDGGFMVIPDVLGGLVGVLRGFSLV